MALDLNARRAAQAEKQDPYATVELGVDESGAAKVWRFFSDPAIEAISRLRRGDIQGAVAMLIEPTEFEAFLEQRPTIGDLNAIVEHISGVAQGNSSASTPS